MTCIFDGVPLFRPVADEKDYDCREGCFMRLYRGVSAEEAEGYADLLQNTGYDILQRHENNSNLFFLLRGDKTVTLLFSPCDSTLRVTVAPNGALPQLKAEDAPQRCGTTFYMFENDHTLIDCGMCLLIQCCDYSFFIVDSGHYYQFNDNDRIYRFMRERTPEGQNVVVSGWFITHSHSDHISKLVDFLKYNREDVVIEGFYSNLISNKYRAENWGPECITLAERLFMRLEESDIPCIKLHSGMRFFVRNLTFDVLCTHEDIYPQPVCDYNDSSAVLMMTAYGTKVCIPGDAAVLASRVLEARFGDSLKCDVVQIAHHGHTGLSSRFYELANADAALFPITRIKFDEEYPRIEANRRAIELSKEHYISSDGTIEIALPYVYGNTKQLPDESFEDFVKIKALWGYDYTDERKKELFEIFKAHGGNLDKLFLPVSYLGSFID